MALRDYYNYLAMAGFTNAKDIRVKPKIKVGSEEEHEAPYLSKIHYP